MARSSPSADSRKSSGPMSSAPGRGAARSALNLRSYSLCRVRRGTSRRSRSGSRARRRSRSRLSSSWIAWYLGEPCTPSTSTVSKYPEQSAPQLVGVVFDEVVGVDDLVRPAEGQPVRRGEHSAASGLEHADDLREHSLRVGDVLDRMDRDYGGERPIGEREHPHVRDVRLTVLTGQRVRVHVDADCLARGERTVRMADPAAEIEHAAGRQKRRNELVFGRVALVARVEPALCRAHALAADRGARRHGAQGNGAPPAASMARR